MTTDDTTDLTRRPHFEAFKAKVLASPAALAAYEAAKTEYADDLRDRAETAERERDEARAALGEAEAMLARTEVQIHEPGGFIDRMVDAEAEIERLHATAGDWHRAFQEAREEAADLRAALVSAKADALRAGVEALADGMECDNGKASWPNLILHRAACPMCSRAERLRDLLRADGGTEREG